MKILITGGAGFIGTNLINSLINDDRTSLVRVIDDLSTGFVSNINPFTKNPKFEFINGNICDYQTCLAVTKGIDRISHQAALGSVPRSISNPILTSQVNVFGTINLLHASYINHIDRVVIASSSSVYGDNSNLIKKEQYIGKALSPYAATKQSVELFAETFNGTYGLNYICLRYFNVFGPFQDFDTPYAAVIPRFCKACIDSSDLLIYGNGQTSRDFTFISNVIAANLIALFINDGKCLNNAYNIGCGVSTSLNEIVSSLSEISGRPLHPKYLESRIGDIHTSQADITKTNNLLGYEPTVYFKEGLALTFNYYANLSNKLF